MFDFEKLNDVKIGIVGDFALDIYWHADMKKSELSRETPHFPLPVDRERIYPGAAGNVAACIAALKPAKLALCGVIGDDWRGMLIEREFEKISADTTGIIKEEGRFTNTYCKPMRRNGDVEYEDPRIDFAAQTPPSAETEAAVLAWIDKMERELDVICVCEQFACSIITDAIRERLCRCRTTVIADSRSNGHRYHNVILKPNEQECRGALIALGAEPTTDDAENGEMLSRLTGCRVMLTLGERGSLWVAGKLHHIAPFRYDGPVDFCGAGDAFLSAFASFTAAGVSPDKAGRYASAASSVTIRKLGVTGTASREEIREVMGQ
ncbi:MAG: sugar kinase [Ruminococcaceae bacterium]|nr:sugar kinase [Oscillospiraceae bacterium]